MPRSRVAHRLASSGPSSGPASASAAQASGGSGRAIAPYPGSGSALHAVRASTGSVFKQRRRPSRSSAGPGGGSRPTRCRTSFRGCRCDAGGGGQVDGVLQLARRLPADRLEPFNGVLREGLLLLAGNGALGRWSGTIPLALACLNTLTSMARLVGRLWRHRVKELSEHLMVIWSSGLALMALSS
jgi:hypothetical protein